MKIYFYFKQILFYLFLSIFILLFMKALFFKEVSPLELLNSSREITRELNIKPFKTIIEYSTDHNFNLWIALMNIVGNIILFIPAGLYLQIFQKNKKVLLSVVLIFAISMSVELIQYMGGIGRTDIDDIILNTLGGLLGIGIYKILYSLLKDKNKIKTAITFLFFIIVVCAYLVYFYFTKILGLKIKIF